MKGRVAQERLKFTPRGDRYIQSLAYSCFFNGRLVQSGYQLGDDGSRLAPKMADLLLSLLTDHQRWLAAGVENLRHYIFSGRPHIFSRAIHFRCPLFFS